MGDNSLNNESNQATGTLDYILVVKNARRRLNIGTSMER